MESVKRCEDAGEMDEAEVVGGCLFVAGRDAAKLLESVDEPFDDVSQAIERPVVTSRRMALATRDDRSTALLADLRSQGVAVIAFVGDDAFRLRGRDQFAGHRHVMSLAAGQAD